MSTTHHTHPPAQPDPRRWKALALLCTAFFMVILDSAIVVVALPSIDADLAFSAGNLQWVLSAYLLSFGGLLRPLTERIRCHLPIRASRSGPTAVQRCGRPDLT